MDNGSSQSEAGEGEGSASARPLSFALCPGGGAPGKRSARSDGSCGPAAGVASSRVPSPDGRRPEVPAGRRSRLRPPPPGPSRPAPPCREPPSPFKGECACARFLARLECFLQPVASGRTGKRRCGACQLWPRGLKQPSPAPSRGRHPERTVPTSFLDTAPLWLARHLALPPDPAFL